jgi:hypothetical protein
MLGDSLTVSQLPEFLLWSLSFMNSSRGLAGCDAV